MIIENAKIVTIFFQVRGNYTVESHRLNEFYYFIIHVRSERLSPQLKCTFNQSILSYKLFSFHMSIMICCAYYPYTYRYNLKLCDEIA